MEIFIFYAVIHSFCQKLLQSVPLVCKVFKEKTLAALTASQKLKINEGSICVFVQIITNWFKMMSNEDKYSVSA